MSSSKYINLTIAAILAASSLLFVIATCSIGDVSAESKTSGPILKSKILRRNDKFRAKPDAAELAALRKTARVQDGPDEQRVIDNQIPGHLPIKVKFRAEKEKAAKDLSNGRWHRDLELEVKNTGDKPIFYISFIIEIPEIKLGGNPVSLHMGFGQHSLFDESKGRAAPEEEPLKPKETYILTLDDDAARAWEEWKDREKWAQPKKVLIIFEELNFGDGKGYFGGNGAPWPFPRQPRTTSQGLYSPRVTDRGIKTHHATSTSPKSLWSSLIGGESATFWPTSFPFGNLSPKSSEPGQAESEADYCCPDDCHFVDIQVERYCYYCPRPLSRANGVSCIYEFDGICATVQPDQELCRDGIYCPYDKTYPCGYVPPGPTPTASPSPTPTAPPCDAETKPNNTNCLCDTIRYIIAGAPPEWVCSCSAGVAANHLTLGSNQGCEPNKYNNGNNCCVCIVQECLDGSTPNKTTCQCATPTPTPRSGGGGATYRGEYYADYGFYYGYYAYYDECTVYVWVTYRSYDGGETWEETGEVEYAGCW